MRRLFTLLLVAVPFMANAQSPHHFEIGAGYAMHTEMLVDQKTREEKGTLGVFGEYRFDITPSIAVGAQYFFAPTHNGTSVNDADGMRTVSFQTRTHTANLFAQFLLKSAGPLTPFVAVGGGTQCRYMFPDYALEGDYYWTPDVYIRFGFQFAESIRISVGHFHDLNVPFSSLPHGAPCYFVAASWVF